MKRNFFLSFFMFPLAISMAGQDFTTTNDDTIILGNSSLVRTILTDEEGISSIRLSMEDEQRSYIEPCREFSFLLNGKMVDGLSGWRLSGRETIRDENAGEGIRLMLEGSEELVVEGVSVEDLHTVSNNLEVGLTRPGQDFPFRKYLAPGENWETPRTFICLYRDRDDGFAVIDYIAQRTLRL